MAWTARVALDAVVLHVLAGGRFAVGELRLPRVGAWLAAATAALVLARLPGTGAAKAAFVVAALSGVGLAAWWGVLVGERGVLRARFTGWRGWAAGTIASRWSREAPLPPAVARESGREND